MKINSTHGIIHIPNYVVGCIYHSKEMDDCLKSNKYKIDKKKSKELSQKKTFEDILKEKMNSTKKR